MKEAKINNNPPGIFLPSFLPFPLNNTGTLLTLRWPNTVPSIEGYTAIAWFHSHPGMNSDLPAGRRIVVGPGLPADMNYANLIGLPGLIKAHEGNFYFGPTFRPTQPLPPVAPTRPKK